MYFIQFILKKDTTYKHFKITATFIKIFYHSKKRHEKLKEEKSR